MPGIGDEEPGQRYAQNAEFWIGIIREGLDRYRTELTDDVVLAAAEPIAGSRILDAGCGEGYLSRRLARAGAAEVVGVDACAPFIEAARAMARDDDLDITYHLGSVTDLPLEDGRVDLVVCNHVANSLPEIAGPFAEFGRVLRPGGRLVIMMLHPCFYTARAGIGSRREQPRPEEYFRVRAIEHEFQVAGVTSPARTVTWCRPLEDYVSALAGAGFVISDLAEPRPSGDRLERSDWWRENFPRPLFMLLVARLGSAAR